MKNIMTALTTGVFTMINILLFETWYANVPYYLTELQSYVIIGLLVVIASIGTNLVFNQIDKHFNKKDEEVKVNWLTVDED